MTDAGHPVHCNKADAIVALLSKTNTRISHLSIADLEAHWTGEAKYYFAGNGNPKKPYTLCCLDADAHKCGTVAGCVRVLGELGKRFGLDRHIEQSPRGAHGYFIVEKLGDEAGHINMVLGMLAKQVRQDVPADVEGVEVKGTCPEITWGQSPICGWGIGGSPVQKMKLGGLCPIPQQKEPFDKWRLTATAIKLADLHKRVSVDYVQAISRPERVAKTRRVRQTGSFSGIVIGQDELDQLNGHYQDVAATLLQTHKLKAGRAVVTVADVAVFLLLLRFFTQNMNPDGSLPYRRFETLWNALYEAGDTDRAFDPKRFAAIRNYISRLGLLKWEDAEYTEPLFLGEHKIKGQAAKWKASDRLMEMLDWQRFSKGKGERASLAGTEIQGFVDSLVQSPESEAIVPVKQPSQSSSDGHVRHAEPCGDLVGRQPLLVELDHSLIYRLTPHATLRLNPGIARSLEHRGQSRFRAARTLHNLSSQT